MSETVTDTTLVGFKEDSPSHSQLLGSSIGLLPSKSRREPSQISRIYKQASNLFLTRRLPEALSTLELVVTQPAEETSTESSKPAPIANANRSSRIKVWSLYLTLVNAIIELGPDDGKATFGSKVWRNIAGKARDGSIWEEVVQVGYNGIEGNVDADVVINLATLLLSQSPSQSINQQRLESYLSASNEPSLDLKNHFDVLSEANVQTNYTEGDTTPRVLASRIKILELYSLYILPRNSELAYAKEFITLSEILDEERREAFLQALQSQEDEMSKDHDQEKARVQEQGKNGGSECEQVERTMLEEVEPRDERHREEQKATVHKRTESEKDYGIDGPHPVFVNRKTSSRSPRPMTKLTKEPLPTNPRSSSSNKSTREGIYKRGLAIMNALQHLISNMTHSLSKNPISLLRFVLFLMGLIAALSRRDVKERVRRITSSSWDKLKRTVGMGVKVSYI